MRIAPSAVNHRSVAASLSSHFFSTYSVRVAQCSRLERSQQNDDKHNCVLSNAGLSNALTETGICASLNLISIFGFIHHWIQSRHCWILPVHGIWCWFVQKCAHQSMKTAKMKIRTPPKSANCFQFVSQIGVDAPTFLSRLQNLVKIGKELSTCG